MNIHDYRRFIADECIRYAPPNEREYLLWGLVAEVGEVAGELAKHKRDCGGSVESLCPTHRARLLDELGDVLWFCARITDADVAGDGCEFGVHLRIKLPILDGVADMVGLAGCRVAYAIDVPHWWPDEDAIEGIAANALGVASHLGVSPEALMRLNVDKLRDRQMRRALSNGWDTNGNGVIDDAAELAAYAEQAGHGGDE